MSKTDCIVCRDDGILTSGNCLNIEWDFGAVERFICFDCLSKNMEHNASGGGLRIFGKKGFLKVTHYWLQRSIVFTTKSQFMLLINLKGCLE